jgi:MFS transporter, CP family, cyanate transporter
VTAAAAARSRIDPALVAILGGVVAALHVGKLPPAIPALQAALGLTLVQAGFLLSMVQIAGMSVGVAFGAWADALGPRRSMLIGLWVLTVASALGAAAPLLSSFEALGSAGSPGSLGAPAAMLMALRACEGFGFLLVVLAAPALVRRLVAPERLSLMLGLWGAYMPLATALALLCGPWVIGGFGWPMWWGALALLTAAMALVLARAVPVAAPMPVSMSTSGPGRGAAAASSLRAQLTRTLAAPGPWCLALAFAVYAGQWLAVVGFLPTVYAQAGFAPALTGVLTALAAAVNVIGNISAGRLLHRGAAPARLLMTGYAAMALGAFAAFAAVPSSWTGGAEAQSLLPPAARYVAVLFFSGVGGLIPATLFALAVPATPREGSLSTTVGWIQQWSAFGQFAGPPLVAWVAAAVGGWHWTWGVTAALASAGLALAAVIARKVALPGRSVP